jgi:hypothetical protein
MVYAAVPAIRRAAPRALVLIGGTAALGTDHPTSPQAQVPPLTFLRALACVDERLQPVRTGACAAFRPLPGDGWAHHPYSPRVPPDHGDPQPDTATLADMGRLTTLLTRLHTAGRIEEHLPLYISEFGYETNPPDPTQAVTLADQARWLPEAEDIAHHTPGVKGFAQFLLRDLPAQNDFQTGLLLPDGRPKPALRSFAYSLAVRRAGKGIGVFVHVRPGHGKRRIRIETRPSSGGPWASLGEAETDEDGFAELSSTANPRNSFRLAVRESGTWQAKGVPVAGAT